MDRSEATKTSFEQHIYGLDTSGLVETEGGLLHPDAAIAFAQLQSAASAAGLDLRIASAYRSFERQLAIWNGKLNGERRVCDEQDRPLEVMNLSIAERVSAVLRFTALPGSSRHHWGTDIDVFDASAVAHGYKVQLSAAEVAVDGCFAPLHNWLDERIESGNSFGFYRPYDQDRGGVAQERWHLSFAPVAAGFAAQFDARGLTRAWDQACQPLMLREYLEPNLDTLLERYVYRVAAPAARLRECVAGSPGF